LGEPLAFGIAPGRQTLEKALAGSRNLRFDEVARLAEAFGFRLARTRGSHHIFVHDAFRSC
jgi:DNA-binding phage protein